MYKSLPLLALIVLVSGCDMGTYTPAAHHGDNASMTGSRLSGIDTGAGNDTSDPSLRQVQSGTGGGH